jgi:hypothetical protein
MDEVEQRMGRDLAFHFWLMAERVCLRVIPQNVQAQCVDWSRERASSVVCFYPPAVVF